jgi:hypothetical protein
MAEIKVYLDDRNQDYDQAYERFIDAGSWAQDHCESFVSYEVVDVSDHTILYDQVAEYVFRDERDAVAFTLKWKQ